MAQGQSNAITVSVPLTAAAHPSFVKLSVALADQFGLQFDSQIEACRLVIRLARVGVDSVSDVGGRTGQTAAKKGPLGRLRKPRPVPKYEPEQGRRVRGA
jgi:hypothetical protein